MSVTEKKPKLKWHRFVQIIILPVMIISSCYSLISYFTDLFGLDLSWTDHSLKRFLELGGADVFHLGIYFWPVIIVLAFTLIRLILALYAWIGSFRWRKYSFRSWLALLTFSFLAACAGLWAIWEYGLDRGGMIQWLQYVSSATGRQIRIDSSLFTLMRVLIVLIGVLILLYTIANYIYYAKRKHLFTSDEEDYQMPYEKPEESVIAEPQSVPDVHAQEPVPAEAQREQIPPEQPVFPADPEPVIMEAKEAEEPAKAAEPEKDELTQMLEETEKSFTQLAAGIVDEPETEPVSIIHEEPQETEEVQPEEPVIRSIPVYEQAEQPEELEETQLLHTVTEVPQEEINFCPDCGTRIPDPSMRFCIHCGRKIR